jgi:hypothetical protein
MTAAAPVQNEKGFPITGKFLFGAIEPNKKFINLSSVI